jgi:secreted PhoX family phosphatase
MTALHVSSLCLASVLLAPLALSQSISVSVVPPTVTTVAGPGITTALPMMRGDTPATSKGFVASPIFTIGETFGTYQPVGLPDGMGAFKRGETISLLVSHELTEGAGYTYSLANGTQLRGARISVFNIGRQLLAGQAAVLSLNRAGLAYDAVYDRQGVVVTSAAQINETGNAVNGLARFCSATAVQQGTYGLVDNVFFANEETSKPFHPHGGTVWALDVQARVLWAVPAMGRGSWENVCPLDSGDPTKVAFLLGDDSVAAPLYLYVGEKNAVGDGSFLDRNGLAVGKVYAWKADNGDTTPQQFNGLNSSRTGSFVQVTVQDAAKAGTTGYDAFGYADIDTLQAEADALGCFSFSRPEDLATNPLDGTQAVFASTGRGQQFPADNWGDTLVVDVDFSNLTAELVIVNDSDSLAVPDSGIRSPDNLIWALDGKAYIQEDKSTSPGSLFGGVTGIEASMWQLDLVTRTARRVLEIDRSAVPAGQVDGAPNDKGNWESSGVIDVTGMLPTFPGERLFMINVEAHSLTTGTIGGSALLGEGGQILLVSKLGQ